MKQVTKRAYRINYNYGLNPHSEVKGGLKAGRFWSNHPTVQKSNKKRLELRTVANRALTIARVAFCIGLLASAIYISHENSKPTQNQVEAKTEEPNSPLPLNGAKEFTSADAPYDFEERDVTAREYREPTTEELIENIFGEYSDKAIKIFTCESGLDNSKHNYNPRTKDDSYGIAQINLWGNNKKSRPTPEQLADPETNIRFARVLFDSANQTFGSNWTNCSRKNGIR